MVNKNNAFTQDNFCNNGGYLTYQHGNENHFIGRFKYGGLGHFKKFLMKNFEVQEYLDRLEAGETPDRTTTQQKAFMGELKGYAKDQKVMYTRNGFDRPMRA